MSFEQNIELLQKNALELTKLHDFEYLINNYESSVEILNELKKKFKSLEDKSKKITKSRKKINVEQTFEILETNSQKFENSELSFEDKVELYRNSISLINLLKDKIVKQELKINYHD